MASSNGSVAPIAHTTKSLKSTSFNGRASKVTEVIIPHNFLLCFFALAYVYFFLSFHISKGSKTVHQLKAPPGIESAKCSH